MVILSDFCLILQNDDGQPTDRQRLLAPRTKHTRVVKLMCVDRLEREGVASRSSQLCVLDPTPVEKTISLVFPSPCLPQLSEFYINPVGKKYCTYSVIENVGNN